MASKNTSKNKADEKVHVAIRCRPTNESEKRSRIKCVVETSDREVQVTCNNNIGKTYKFDKVFGPSSKQVDVYRNVVAPHIDEVLAGYNCTVLAYGQTGTGKTFTMEGERSGEGYTWENDPKAGIIPRTLSQLFDRLEKESSEFSIHVSLLEIYNEVIYDLLSPTAEPAKRRIYDDSSRKGSVVIADQTEVRVLDRSEVYNILEQGAAKRRTDATLMNEFSSRSHSVFTVTVHSKELTKNGYEEEELVKIGKLNLVDLAGSENIGRSGAVEMRAREAGNINQSLLTLGRCITALVDHAPHVPYRESRLTRILQDSLGGSTKTSIIGTISPGVDNLEESLSTLDYASRAKNIQNKPIVNKKMTKRTLIKQYDNEIENLRRELMATREKNGVYMEQKQYDEQHKRLEDLEMTLSQRQEEFEKLKILFADITEEMKVKSEEYAVLQQEFHETKAELGEQSYLKDMKGEHGTKVVEEAHQVVEVANEMTEDIVKVHAKVVRMKDADEMNKVTAEQSSKFFQEEVKELNAKTQDIIESTKKNAENSKKVIENFRRRNERERAELGELMEGWKSTVNENMTNCMSTMSTMMQNSRKSVKKETDSLQRQEENMTDCLDRFCGSMETKQKNLQEKFETLMNLNTEMEKFIKRQVVRQYEMVVSHEEKISQDLEKIIQTTKEMEDGQKSRLDTMFDTMKEMFMEQLTHVQSNGSAIRETVNSMSKDGGTFVTESTELKDELEEESGVILEKATTTLSKIREDTDELVSCSVKHGENNDKMFKESSSLVQGRFGRLNEEWEKTENKMEEFEEESTESSSAFSSSTSQLLQQSGEAFINDVSILKESSLDILESQEKLSTIVQESTDKVGEQITKFCDSDLVHVKPTGETPVRREYVYPKNFKFLPPDDELLKSFHEKLALEEEEEDEEEEILEEQNEENQEPSIEMLSKSDSSTSGSIDTKDDEPDEDVQAGGGVPFFLAGKQKNDAKHHSRIRTKIPLRSTQNFH